MAATPPNVGPEVGVTGGTLSYECIGFTRPSKACTCSVGPGCTSSSSSGSCFSANKPSGYAVGNKKGGSVRLYKLIPFWFVFSR